MHELLKQLSQERPVFHSEADFQHALAWQMQLANPSIAIRLEMPFSHEDTRAYLDLSAKSDALHMAVELKYKTKKSHFFYRAEEFKLRNQGAQDLGRYDFLKDIARIESYVESYAVTHHGAQGYAILLTNDASYWQESAKATAIDSAFRIHEGRSIEGELAWGSGASDGTKKNREQAIQIRKSYKLSWQDFSIVGGHLFRYLLVHVR